MSNCAISGSRARIWIWVIWLVVVSAGLLVVCHVSPWASSELLLAGVVSHDAKASGPLFPWQPQGKVKKWAWRKYQLYRQRVRRVRRRAQLARLALSGVVSMAQVVDWFTASQVHYKLGALPVLYALLASLEVGQIINRHCPTRGDVDHGTTALVLVLNRLMLPLPLYQVSDWIGQTVLADVVGVEAAKFNDDRLGRTLDALYPHLDAIWREIMDVALVKANIDLSVLYYDLTGIVGHGRYPESELMDFGFAHNTPSNKRKLKLGTDVSADGNLPITYELWSGRTTDQATVQHNLANLTQWLTRHGYAVSDSLVVGDRAMLNAEIALTYDEKGLRHLTGLRAVNDTLKGLISRWSDEEMAAYPIVDGPAPNYWGREVPVTFEHEGRTTTHRGLVVLSGPLRDQWRQTRRDRLDALDQELETLRQRIGQPRFRTLPTIRRSVNARLKESKVASFVRVYVSETPTGDIEMHWHRHEETLAQAERKDGRYLLVTNDPDLTPQAMFQLYRDKDGVETCFHIAKDDLAVSPLYLHGDQRIAAMLFINMVALLAYNLLQRQCRQQGIAETTRRLIQRLDRLTIIETRCWDGSALRRLTPVDPELLALLDQIADALQTLVNAQLGTDAAPLLIDHDSVPQLPLLC